MMQVFKNKKGRSFRPAKHRHIGKVSNDFNIANQQVNKISKYCPAWLARKKEINRQQQLDALLLASTPAERVRIQKARRLKFRSCNIEKSSPSQENEQNGIFGPKMD